ncbi:MULTISPECIES: hypothetical protein [Helicobacter]|uniref:Uncharacterized protein n=5 Tax=Helicobacter TaxID=209 RepID=A0AAI8QH81_9HELI|nr:MULTISPECIES: hypothetical protein [Helicobacter]EFR47674.1 hypothetical protein HCCG_02223 [Helicobacter cinaedi CCUG 18818 = ATCC BAA-847]TLD82960.1 hypothetical protein LS81_006330 [Helicobacter trogontum]BAM32742.1 hypothetical protein HCBAA847_1512 [Helicobacter cinaedi CCUG 18818 = ATCC BAA-847]STQ85092.1 Uncharacterised protein [Helicobacter fennelliae]
MVLLYMWLKQGISDFDNLVLAITWIFYFIIMPFIISMLNKTEFFNAIFYAKRFFMLWIITILLGTTCAILYFGWDWLLLLNIAATGITTITLTLLPVLNTDSKHKMNILESLFVFLIFCIIFVDNVIASPFFILFYGTSLIGLGGR